jgi:EmrB/QacA subfamily drug resistance transporter
MIGKKRIYTLGFAVFTLGSLLCGMAAHVYLLILFRVVQAFGATMIMALGAAIVTESFPPKERGKALGIIGTIVSVGIVIGPTLGGLIIDLLNWNWIFFVNIPVGIVGILMVIRFVPDIQPIGKQRFDFLGGITLFVSLLAFLIALTAGQNIGFTDERTLGLFVLGVVSLVIFVLVELRAEQPMIDLKLFRNTLFSINLITGFITFVAIAGTFILMPFFLENILNYSPRQVGLLIAAVPITMGVIAPIAGSLSDRFGSRIITFIGLAILLCGYFLLQSLNVEISAFTFVLILMPIGLGMGIFQSPNNSAIMGAAQPDKLGVVSGMLSLTRVLGQSTGIAINGAIWAAFTLKFTDPVQIVDATKAPAAAQIAGLHTTYLFITAMILFALLLALWALLKERLMKPTQRTLKEESATKV